MRDPSRRQLRSQLVAHALENPQGRATRRTGEARTPRHAIAPTQLIEHVPCAPGPKEQDKPIEHDLVWNSRSAANGRPLHHQNMRFDQPPQPSTNFLLLHAPRIRAHR